MNLLTIAILYLYSVISVTNGFSVAFIKKDSRPKRVLTCNVANIQVFDGVIDDEDTRWELHDLATEHSLRSRDGSSIFYRPSDNLTPLESALDKILTEIGDESPIVEYWSRDEFINIDVHSDIDETELEEDGVIRCPEWGHVLYLVVKEGLRGPTCVFPGQPGGWVVDYPDEDLDLVVVPAVEGRVLRFPGNAMHAVPKPADRWLLPDEDERELRKEEEAQVEDEGDIIDKGKYEDTIDDSPWDDDDDDEVEVERSVVLFNTWTSGKPRGVEKDFSDDGIPDGIEIAGVDMDSYKTMLVSQRQEDWKEDYGSDFEMLSCKKKEEWIETDLTSVAAPATHEEDVETAKVKLMGKRERRLSLKARARFIVPPIETANSLSSPFVPSHIVVQSL